MTLYLDQICCIPTLQRQAKTAGDHASKGANTPEIPKDAAPDSSHDQVVALIDSNTAAFFLHRSD